MGVGVQTRVSAPRRRLTARLLNLDFGGDCCLRVYLSRLVRPLAYWLSPGNSCESTWLLLEEAKGTISTDDNRTEVGTG